MSNLPLPDSPLRCVLKPGRVSVITAVYNAASALEECILSVRSQSYHDVEHVIIDGGSTDGSLEILGRHASHLAYCRSEPDDGVFEAWNKGLAAATDEWIAFLGGDDRVLPDAIQHYRNLCRGTDTQYVLSPVRWTRPGHPDKIIGEP